MRRSVAVTVLVASALLTWGLWPLGDARFEIRFDADKGRLAKEFLARPITLPTAKPPNVVLIVADDLGKHDISVYGPSPTPTPSLSALAAGGTTFSAGYVTAPVCSPSRAALMTGRYQQRYGFELLTHDRYPSNRLELWFARNVFSTHGWTALDTLAVPRHLDMEHQGLPPSELTLAELLKKRGYATAAIGKWHLGFGEQALPRNRGFDHQYGFYDAFSLYADPDRADVMSVRGTYFADRYQWWQGRNGGSAIRRDDVVVEEDGYLTDKIADEAIGWIEAHHDGPFFAYVPFSAPHAPMQAPRALVERFANVADPDKRIYYAMIAALDAAVGRILATLDELHLADDTIVVFLSDNGAASYTGIIDNAPLKGGKLTNFEGGINVPFLLRWPRRVAAAATYREPVSTLDVFMTIARAASVELPTDREYDGVDLVPYLGAITSGSPHDALFWRTGGHRAIRVGRYKLVSDTTTGSQRLYDLEADPYEKTCILAANAELAAGLERRLRTWEAGLVPPAWPNVMEYRFSDDGRRYIFPL